MQISVSDPSTLSREVRASRSHLTHESASVSAGDSGDGVEGYGDATLVRVGSHREYELKGTRPGAKIRIRVRACSHAATGPWSPWHQFLSAALAPDPVKRLSVSCIDGTGVCVEWSAPREHGAPVTSYLLQMRCLDLHKEGTDNESGA